MNPLYTNLVLPWGLTIASDEAPTSTRVVAASWSSPATRPISIST
jgi:hypothetical protein